jgi:hypothetical protein
MNLYCDNHATCGELVWDQGGKEHTEAVARVKGWHLFDGLTMGGAPHKAALGPRCVGTSRREAAPQVLAGQEELF